MTWNEDGYIVIHDWDDHNPGHTRNYTWVKVSKKILHDPKFLDLTMAQRGVLLGLWLLTGDLGLGCVPSRIRTLLRLLQVTYSGDSRQLRRHLVSLNDAGLITVAACKPHASCIPNASESREEREEREPLKVLSPSLVVGEDSSPGPERPAPNPRTQNGQPRKPSATELDDDLRPLSFPTDLPGQRRDRHGFLY